MAQIQIAKISEVTPYLKQIKSFLVLGMLFSGDRISCCDEAVVISEGDQLIAIATIAPYGENTGNPTIVGVYVTPEYRKQGYGTKVVDYALNRCCDRNLTPVHIDAMTPGMKKICDAMNQDLISVSDFSGDFRLFPSIFD